MSMRVLAERNEQGEHELKSRTMWRLLREKIIEVPR